MCLFSLKLPEFQGCGLHPCPWKRKVLCLQCCALCLQSAIITLQCSLRESALQLARWYWGTAGLPAFSVSSPSFCATFTASSAGWPLLGGDLPNPTPSISSGKQLWHRADGSWASRQHQVIKDLSVPISGLRNSLVALTPAHGSLSLLPPALGLVTPCNPTLWFCRGASLRRGVWLQVHWDLGSCAAQRQRALRGHRAAGPAPQGQQGEEREAAGTTETEREHPQESQALLGQNSCQEQQEHGLQTQVQVLPWPISTLRTLDSARACGILWTLSNFVIGQSINLY